MQRGHHFCIVDEIDSILIDEARTPLIISGKVADQLSYAAFASIARGLQRDVPTSRRGRCCPLEEGIAPLSKRGVDNLYDQVSNNLVHQPQAALQAKELYKRDRDYLIDVVRSRSSTVHRPTMEGRRWSTAFAGG